MVWVWGNYFGAEVQGGVELWAKRQGVWEFYFAFA